MLGVLLCLCDSDLLLGLRLRLERKKRHGLMAGMVSSFFFFCWVFHGDVLVKWYAGQRTVMCVR
jgi:hypothetical protein